MAPGPDSPPEKTSVGFVPVLRVFLSSPGDVAPERQAALVVLRRLQARYRGTVLLVPVLWEHEPLLASAGFQEGIADRLPPSASDIAVFVLWSRLGTPLSSNFTLPDGRRPTGTEWEFEEAMQSRKTQDTPDILVYRKTEAPKAALVEGRDSVSERVRQYESVGAFFDRHFKDATDLTFRGAFHNFTDAADLAALLDIHLTALLEERFRGRECARAVVWHESPFRGLETFEARHWPIYFGRTRAQDDVLLALGRQVAAGRAFVLVVGVSGSGKSSLLRAGVLPFLDHPGAVEPQLADAGGCCRHAIVRPADGATPTEALCAALVAEGALPDLRRAGSPPELARVFSESPAAAVAHIRAELSRFAATGRAGAGRETPPPARLVLLVDQLEEIFTREGVTNGDRESFVAILDAMARSGLAWVLATLRSDFYPGLASLPALLVLKDGEGQYDLPAVEGEDWTRIVRLPAQAAGLEYERDPSGTGDVADRLIAEASRVGRDALPLLQFALQELYERRDQRPDGPARLSWKAYSDLGGLSGAVRARADAEWDRLSQEARAAFPHVLRSLVEASPGQEAIATRRRAPLAEVSAQVGAKEIVERFVAARLLVVEGDRGGAVVSVAHEALLRTWPRASEQIAREASLLRLRTWLRARTAEWDRRGRRGGLLTSADELADGRALRASGFALTPAEAELLVASESRHRRTRAARCAGVALLAAFAVAAVAFGLDARSSAGSARDQATRADIASAAARQQQRVAQSIALASKSKEVLDSTPALSLLLAREGVRRARTGEAVTALHGALASSLERVRFSGHQDKVSSAVFSPHGEFVLTASYDTTARIWSSNGREIVRFAGHTGAVRSAAFSPDGERVLTASEDMSARLWSLDGKEVARFRGHGYAVKNAIFSPNGQLVLTASDDGTARIWSLDGTELKRIAPEGRVAAASFSPNGSSVLITARTRNSASLWGLDGKEVANFLGHASYVNAAVFSPDGTLVLTASEDRTARLWSIDGAELMRFSGHDGGVTSASFSPDGLTVLTCSADGTARLWSLDGKELKRFAGLNPSISGLQATFSPNGQRVLTVWDDGTGRVWALDGQEVARFSGHESRITSVLFSLKGDRVLTASWDGTARLWSPSGGEISRFGGDLGRVSTVAFSPDGRRVLAACGDGTARVWTLDGKEVVRLSGHGCMVCGAAFSQDGERVLTIAIDGRARLWSIGGKELEKFGHRSSVVSDIIGSVAISPDGQWVLASSHEPTASLWSLAGKEVMLFSGHEKNLTSAVFSPDGKSVLTASWDKTARLWSLDGREVTRFSGHEGWVEGATFSPDGMRVLTASQDKTARLWSLEGKEIARFSGHLDVVSSAVFSPDGKGVLTASWDKTTRLWTLNGTEVSQFPGQQREVLSATFSPDGRLVATAGNDGTVSLFCAGVDDSLALAAERITTDFTPAERARYRVLLEDDGDGR